MSDLRREIRDAIRDEARSAGYWDPDELALAVMAVLERRNAANRATPEEIRLGMALYEAGE